jgi:hypothetical protein
MLGHCGPAAPLPCCAVALLPCCRKLPSLPGCRAVPYYCMCCYNTVIHATGGARWRCRVHADPRDVTPVAVGAPCSAAQCSADGESGLVLEPQGSQKCGLFPFLKETADAVQQIYLSLVGRGATPASINSVGSSFSALPRRRASLQVSPCFVPCRGPPAACPPCLPADGGPRIIPRRSGPRCSRRDYYPAPAE